MGERKARELDVMFLETSAKSGHNVKQVRKPLLYLKNIPETDFLIGTECCLLLQR